jgi:hypothetical protein
MSKPPELSTLLPNSRTGDGRFAKGNPVGPGGPRGAPSALDQLAVEASPELIKIFLDLARAGNLEALKRMMVLLGKFPRNRRKCGPAGIRGPSSRTPREAREPREESRPVQLDRRFG